MPERITFTKRSLDALQAPTDKRVYVFDTKVESLAVAVNPTGHKAFYVVKWHQGRPVRVMLGKYPDLLPDQARKQAVQTLGAFASGIDPNTAKRKARSESTLADMWLSYFVTHCKPYKKSWASDEYLWKRHLQAWGGRRVSQITTTAIQQLHAKLGKDHPTGANRALALLSSMFGRCGKEFGVSENPCSGVRRFRENSRDRYMDAAELGRFFQALKHDTQDWQDVLMLALLCGARRGNLRSMAWADIDLLTGTWRVSGQKSKSGVPMLLVLVPEAVEILRRRRQDVPADTPWVFPTRSAAGHLMEVKTAWKRVCDRAGIKGMRYHDLRRTHGSWLAATGASLLMIGRQLGHQTQAATMIYSKLSLDPIRAAVVAGTSAMLAAGQPKRIEDQQDDGNVVDMEADEHVE